ncbi:SAM-dependent methyltransferase [Falsiroseomonas selenitidurans]|uniref:Class I SAM-dependent methyltransferase n=1 Tax=Falsiroseomonas selenitidurans TaxID=2716335 RepID=A0ABX1E4U9_9PROT|nr:cyclopropane-fatty-acyl-phospholipid synthase family protein [Falsiroseomonas selenitidurans]NKC32224.1 class I SAM-dependent methyltransferase [Falsiroseomonas selenitidurans]
MLHAVLARAIRHGRLTVQYPDGRIRHYGDGTGPEAGFRILTRRAAWRLVTNPGLSFGESYMDGAIEPLDGRLLDLLNLLMANMAEPTGHPVEALRALWRQARRRLDQLNPAPRARRNVAHHYDLNGRLYALFLDRDRQYSCAYFPTGQESLEEAQAAKKRHIAAKLRLAPGQEVLDIGCGWGGMALTLARDHGVRVTGITLSEEQLREARRRAAEAGLADRCRFELLDYRAWRRPVDRIVSVGMFEHVGIVNYPAFFRTLARALKPDGVALVHAIGRRDGPGSTNPWLTRYIFPGGYSPALSEVLPAVERSGLWATDVEILRLHYALTLQEWRRRFAANRDAIQSLYDERFCRMFEFYLAASEASFRQGGLINWQLQVSRRIDAVPLTRDYMLEAERALAAAPAG